ncbi:MAG: ribonuclease J [Proteobacteria bacterium]|nr:ribonuclease J [Pseudomonadota bacterium]
MSEPLDPDALHFVPLGGTGEIGMNLNLYGYGGRWLMVDCGVMFGRDGLEHQAWMPDVRFIEGQADRLDGLVLTHAHQDHIGAVRDLWPRLRCPVYATRFAAAMLREQLTEVGLARKVPIRLLEARARFAVGPFDLERIPLAHSTVEMGALVIRTPAGTVLHTADFKLDDDPVVGEVGDVDSLEALANERIDAVVSDSTNADHEGWTGSEGSLVEPLREVLSACTGRVAVSFFASNVARLQTLLDLAEDLGRHPILLGRSMNKTLRAARSAGYLADVPTLLSTRDYGFLPPDKVMLLCTGSQGEPRAALSRLAADSRTDVYLDEGDTVVLSAREIPGNELFVERLRVLFRNKGVRMVEADEAAIHVSGHPRRDELRQLYRWVQPETVVPTHGTPPKLDAHVELAQSMGMGGFRARNGDVVCVAPGPVRRVGTVPVGRWLRDEG